jgi:hypothetical protein
MNSQDKISDLLESLPPEQRLHPTIRRIEQKIDDIISLLAAGKKQNKKSETDKPMKVTSVLTIKVLSEIMDDGESYHHSEIRRRFNSHSEILGKYISDEASFRNKLLMLERNGFLIKTKQAFYKFVHKKGD